MQRPRETSEPRAPVQGVAEGLSVGSPAKTWLGIGRDGVPDGFRNRGRAARGAAGAPI